ncbi:MAG: lipoprotein N-acyltransferase Lnb domain-containing protein [Gemmatirosa sp.]
MRVARSLAAPLAALLVALSAVDGRAQRPETPVPVPTPQAGRGAAARADALAEEDGRAASRLTDDVLAAGAPGVAGAAQGPPPPTAADVASAAGMRVYLMTIGQGDAVWERFGHNALWIDDPARGTDLAYNWGMFDFAQPNFLGRFLTGDTRYWMEGFDARTLASHYATVENRTVVAQELNLTAEQKARLRAYVEWNAREEHKFYRYDYYRDNCSTRVRDAIDLALGGGLRRATAGVATNTSYRWHTRRLVAGDAATYTGIQLALGRPADAPIDAWEESFIPMRLMDHVQRVRVSSATGAAQPLVARVDTLFAARRGAERAAPPTYAVGYLIAGLLIGALLFVLGRAGSAGRRGADAGFAVVAGVWTLLIGLAGTALVLAGTVTRHVFMGRNENLLAVNPLALALFVVLLLAVGFRRPEPRARWRGRAATVAAVLAALTVAGAVLTLLPRVGQHSTELFALLVPVHLALWWALRQRPRQHTA